MFERIGLRVADVEALKRSGAITQEQRGRNTVVFKLRYRSEGRQVVKYLGVDEKLVREVRGQLAALREVDRRRRRLQRLEKATRQGIRRIRERLKPLLKDAGLTFHGFAIRRTRASRMK